MKRQFVNFVFYKVDPAWRRLSQSERDLGKKEFMTVVDEFTSKDPSSKVLTYSYTTVGIRPETDFLLWRITYMLESFQEMSTGLLSTGLGRYLSTPYSYLAMTKRSVYVDRISPEHGESRMQVVPAQSKYLFVYPFVKRRDWYLMTKPARQGIMDEHIEVGSRYVSVKLNTTYSFGLDDQEFVVAFETDKAEDFLDLVMELRETEGSRYTLRDTPTLTCIRKSLQETLDSLGG
jgi:chlorite dismutase